MEITISESCWARVTAELDRTYPLEGVLVPLVALVPARRDFSPCSTMTLEDIRAVVIARAVLVPEDLQVNQYARVGVRAHTDRVVNQEIERLTTRYPRLRACAFLHSHPFAHGSTWPSSGCRGDHEGHMLPLLRRNRDAALDTSFSFIACMGAPWKLQGFALDRDERITDLGFASVVPDEDPRIRSSLQPSHLTRSPMRHVLRRWRRQLKRARLPCRRDELFDGWQRWVIEAGGHLAVVVLLPMDFPKQPPRVHVVHRGSGAARPLQLERPASLAPDAWVQVLRSIQQQEERYELAG